MLQCAVQSVFHSECNFFWFSHDRNAKNAEILIYWSDELICGEKIRVFDITRYFDLCLLRLFRSSILDIFRRQMDATKEIQTEELYMYPLTLSTIPFNCLVCRLAMVLFNSNCNDKLLINWHTVSLTASASFIRSTQNSFCVIFFFSLFFRFLCWWNLELKIN